MTPAVFFQQAAVAHLHARCLCHERIGVLDGAVALGILELLVPVSGDAVELQQPVLETRTRGNLAGTDLVRVRVPRNDSLGPCAARRGADPEDVLQGLLPPIARESAPLIFPR